MRGSCSPCGQGGRDGRACDGLRSRTVDGGDSRFEHAAAFEQFELRRQLLGRLRCSRGGERGYLSACRTEFLQPLLGKIAGLHTALQGQHLPAFCVEPLRIRSRKYGIRDGRLFRQCPRIGRSQSSEVNELIRPMEPLRGVHYGSILFRVSRSLRLRSGLFKGCVESVASISTCAADPVATSGSLQPASRTYLRRRRHVPSGFWWLPSSISCTVWRGRRFGPPCARWKSGGRSAMPSCPA